MPRPGPDADFVSKSAGVPHLPANASDTEPCVGVLARADPNEQESVVLRPDLDRRVPGAEVSGNAPDVLASSERATTDRGRGGDGAVRGANERS